MDLNHHGSDNEDPKSPLKLKNGWQQSLVEQMETGNLYIPHLIEDCFDRGKVCILSIDGGGMRGIIPGKILAQLEELLQTKSGNPEARIADYFDVAAGTSIGGLIATMLFTGDEQGLPLFRAQETWKLIANKGSSFFRKPFSPFFFKSRGMSSPKYSTKHLESTLRDLFVRNNNRHLTLKDTLKPILVPCYDLSTAAPFLFSRAGALQSEAWNFRLWEICRATTAVPSFYKPAQVSSVDGKTTCTAVDGGLVMNNPTAAAITHVLHNRLEFPNIRSVGDLLVLSLGTGQFDETYQINNVKDWGAFQWANPTMKMVLENISDMVDHTVSMSFGDARKSYLRIQATGSADQGPVEMDDPSQRNVDSLLKLADDVLGQKSLQHLPFGGKISLDQTNAERLDWFADQLIEEHKARTLRRIPTVILKKGLEA